VVEAALDAGGFRDIVQQGRGLDERDVNGLAPLVQRRGDEARHARDLAAVPADVLGNPVRREQAAAGGGRGAGASYAQGPAGAAASRAPASVGVRHGSIFPRRPGEVNRGAAP